MIFRGTWPHSENMQVEEGKFVGIHRSKRKKVCRSMRSRRGKLGSMKRSVKWFE
jgi:hypothetical protein